MHGQKGKNEGENEISFQTIGQAGHHMGQKKESEGRGRR